MGNNKWLGAVAVVVIVVAAFLIYRNVTRSGGRGGEFDRDVICEACHEVFVMPMPLDVQPPVVCPKCGEKAVYPAVRCAKCKKVYAAPPSISPMPGAFSRYTCPYCGSHEVEPVALAEE